MAATRTSAEIIDSHHSSPTASTRASSPVPSHPSPSEYPFRNRSRWFRAAVKGSSPLVQSPLVRAVTMEHFKASSSSCPELDQTGKRVKDPSQQGTTPARRPSTSQPITPPRSVRIRDRLRWNSRSPSATRSPSPRVLTPPTFRESSERRRRARDSSVAEGPSGQGLCHGVLKSDAGDMQELAVAGAMVAVLELDRLSGIARGRGEVKDRTEYRETD